MISTMGVLYSLGKDVDETNNDLKGIIAKNIPIPSAVAFIGLHIAKILLN
ncbi:TPA: hypothetical protein SC350_002054 [Campylobacter jejuni]|nr:hypothetical protein [Campylobacter jejuni]